MKRERFDSLVPEFFCALGKLYAENPPFFWDYLFHIAKDLLSIFAYFHQLKEVEDFEYGLDDLVSPLLEEFINNANNPEALRDLMVELSHVRRYLKQELELKSSPHPEEAV
jgi:hypothetical protein